FIVLFPPILRPPPSSTLFPYTTLFRSPFSKVENVSFAPGNISIKWFEDGVLNVAWNCIDRHLAKRGDQTAIIWEGDNPSESKHIDRKSTRLNSSHVSISYAVFCLKKKN